MARYILYVFLVLAVEVGVLFGISAYFHTDISSTLFFGACFFMLFAFLMSSTGDALSKNSEVAVFDTLLGSYKPKHEEATLKISPFLVGSVLCLGVYFIVYYV